MKPPAGDDVVRFGGLVFGLIGVVLSTYNWWKAWDRYKLRVFLTAGKACGDYKGLIATITNCGNRPFAVIRAYSSDSTNRGTTRRPTKRKRLVFHSPTPGKVLNLAPGQSETIEFGYFESAGVPDSIWVEIHTGKTRRSENTPSQVVPSKANHLIFELVQRALDGYVVQLEESKRRIRILERKDDAQESQVRFQPFSLNLPYPTEDGPLEYPDEYLGGPDAALALRAKFEDGDANATDTQKVIAILQDKLGPLLFGKQGRSTCYISWTQRAIDLADDPADLRALASAMMVNIDAIEADLPNVG